MTSRSGAGVDTWYSLGRGSGRVKRAAGVILVVAGPGQIDLSVVVLDVPRYGRT